MTFLSKKQWQSMFDGYQKIFWSILLMLFHINLGYLQFFPDFVGYLVLSAGVSCLRKGSDFPGLLRASVIANVLTAWSVVDFLLSLSGQSDNFSPAITIPITAFVSGLKLLLFYDIFAASANLFHKTGRQASAKEVTGCLRIYLVLETLFSLGTIWILFNPESQLLWIVIFGGILFQIWLASVFLGLKRKYDNSQFKEAEIPSVEIS